MLATSPSSALLTAAEADPVATPTDSGPAKLASGPRVAWRLRRPRTVIYLNVVIRGLVR